MKVREMLSMSIGPAPHIVAKVISAIMRERRTAAILVGSPA